MGEQLELSKEVESACEKVADQIASANARKSVTYTDIVVRALARAIIAQVREEMKPVSEVRALNLAEWSVAPNAGDGCKIVARQDLACDVCGNTPDEDGFLEHGRGCYTQCEEGGGTEYIKDADLAGVLQQALNRMEMSDNG